MDWDTNPPAKGWLPLFLKFHAITSQDHRIFLGVEAVIVLFSYSPFESFCAPLRRHVKLFIASLEFALPIFMLAFDGFPFATPIKDELRMDCSPQLQERHAHSRTLEVVFKNRR